MPVIELSHPIEDGMATYPGLPAPTIDLHTAHAGGRPQSGVAAGFAIGRIAMVGNTGTYLDSPYHRFADGKDVSEIPLDRLVDLPTTVVDVTCLDSREVDVAPADDRITDHAVLFRSGWDLHWGTDAYWQTGPYLSSGTVDRLLAAAPALVGVDFWNVDDVAGPDRPVHTRLLEAGVPIVEHLCRLDRIPDGSRTSVVPLAVVGAPSLPVRAFAIA